jgi:hypothetical protein
MAPSRLAVDHRDLVVKIGIAEQRPNAVGRVEPSRSAPTRVRPSRFAVAFGAPDVQELSDAGQCRPNLPQRLS